VPVTKRNGAQISSDVVGPICESVITLPGASTAKGWRRDHLALLSAGAYGFVMASNYNSRAMAAEVLVNGNKAALVRERQQLDDIWGLEKVPAWLT
jgi:diaminopimelate decarboxylase